MTNPVRRCAYLMETYPQRYCGRPEEKDELCVFHLPKPSAEESSRLSPEEREASERIQKSFEQQFQKLLAEWEIDLEIKWYEFTGFCFPDIILSHLSEEKVFEKPAGFNKARFNWVYFSHATFKQGADFSRAVFRSKAEFGHAVFQEAMVLLAIRRRFRR